ncbi:MAG: hypothetical protein ACQEWF_12170 [Bacillota bacterium]
MKKFLLGSAMLLLFSISTSGEENKITVGEHGFSTSSGSVEVAGCISGFKHHCKRYEL